MSLDDMFKRPEETKLSDTQFEKLLEARERERRTRTGLIAFFGLLVIAAITIVTAVTIVAVVTNG